MKRIKKFNLIIITIFIITNIITVTKCYGTTLYVSREYGGGGKSLKTTTTTIDPDDYKPGDLVEDNTTINFGNKIIGAFQAIGSIVSVFALILIGIKYMMGSIEEKAEYKETMIYYIIGAILVFAISNISAMIYKFSISLNN